jgi:hypothetical protein
LTHIIHPARTGIYFLSLACVPAGAGAAAFDGVRQACFYIHWAQLLNLERRIKPNPKPLTFFVYAGAGAANI